MKRIRTTEENEEPLAPLMGMGELLDILRARYPDERWTYPIVRHLEEAAVGKFVHLIMSHIFGQDWREIHAKECAERVARKRAANRICMEKQRAYKREWERRNRGKAVAR